MNLILELFAGPTLLSDGRALARGSTRPALLCSYLAVAADWVARDTIIALFWPELGEARARQNLRTLLYKCKQDPWGAGLEVEENRLRWVGQSDVTTFQEAISRGQWREAVRLYRGALLAQYSGRETAVFDSWLEGARDELHAAWRDAALHLAAEARADELAATTTLLQAVLRYDYLAEDVVQACMRVQAAAGQKSAALHTFYTFQQKLVRELDIEPLGATLELAEAIRRGEITSEVAVPSPLKALPLPQPLSPFVGRTLELFELKTLLNDAQHRLITLLGPGGIGKTRLALQVLQEADGFADGVAFVPLASVQSAQDIPDAVASALATELSGSLSVAEEVFAALKDKQMLLLIDNVEHVLGGVPFIAQLLTQAPDCTLLSTSRVLLGIAGEVVYDVSGLSIPDTPLDSDLEAYDAAQLFLRTARRVRSDFTLTRADYPALFGLCRLLGGMPLALELAANWVRLFRLPDLLKELEQNLDLLEASGQEVSERHQSMRQVFDYSWQRLSPDEQRSLGALAVFQGGFDRVAASEVLGLSARTLLSLVNKSLVKSGSAGRFFVLEVIRQYASEKEIAERVSYQERHSRYFLGALLESSRALEGSAPGELLSRLEDDLENIRSAWQWALSAGRLDLARPVTEPLRLFLMAKARVQEGIGFFEQALRVPGVNDADFLAAVHLELAYFFRRADQYREASNHAERALAMTAGRTSVAWLEANILCELAHVQTRVGAYDLSLDTAGRALRLAQGVGDPELVSHCRSCVALAQACLGLYEEAEQLFQEVLAYQRDQEQHIVMLRTLSDLGRLLVNMGRPLEAKPLFQEGLERAQSQNLPYELGFMWEGLGQCSYLLGDYAQAQEEAERALACSEQVNDMIGIAVQLIYLARAQLALNRPDLAEPNLQRALAISWAKDEIPEVLKALLIWSDVFVRKAKPDTAADLLHQVVLHPGTDFASKRAATTRLQILDFKGTVQTKPLEQIVRNLIPEPAH